MEASSSKRSTIGDADEPSTKKMTVDLQMKVQMSQFKLVGSQKHKNCSKMKTGATLVLSYLFRNECLHYS